MDFVPVDVALGASGSLVLLVNGSLGVVTKGALSMTAVAGAATITGWVASGAVCARSCVAERARTAAIAVVAGRIFGVLWVIQRVNERLTTMGPVPDNKRRLADSNRKPPDRRLNSSPLNILCPSSYINSATSR
jgi:hypothetical protein